MAWRDELFEAMFRGVPFFVDTAQLSAGRRQARHEYPQRDLPYIEDMGRKAREYRIDAFVIGADYMLGRDALLNAIEQAGSGQLIHPYHGTLQVTVSDCQLTESTQHGGMAKFGITFLEAGSQEEPNAETDTELVLENQVAATQDSIADDFADSFSIDDQSDYVVQDAVDTATDLIALPSFDMGELGLIRADPSNALYALLPEQLQASLGDPDLFARGILALVDQATDLTALLSFSLPTVSATATPSRTKQNSNRTAISNLVVQAATTKRIADLSSAEVAAVDDARLARAEIVELADTILLSETTGQAVSESIIQLRTDAMQHFARITSDLPRLVSIVPGAVRPAIVVAHDWYGDAWYDDGRDEELIERNRIRHPGFVPAGEPIVLLS